MKKLRDSQEMTSISSYYIKTLFLWKIVEVKVKTFWQKKPSFLFKIMVEDLYVAIKHKQIKYFWNEQNNLLVKLSSSLQEEYLNKMRNYVRCIRRNDVANIVAGLLTPVEFQTFEKSDLYKRQVEHYRNSAGPSSRAEYEDSLEDSRTEDVEDEGCEAEEAPHFSKKKFLMSTALLIMHFFNPQAIDNNNDGLIQVYRENTNITNPGTSRTESSREDDQYIPIRQRERTCSYSDSDDF